MFVQYHATEDYVEQFLFCRPLVKHATRKEMYKKVDSFIKKHQLSQNHCVSVRADGASTMMRPKRLMKKKKTWDSCCFLYREYIRQRKKFKSDISFEIYFICCQLHQMPSLTHSLIWCFVWDGGRTQWTFVSFEHPLASMKKDAGASGHAMTPVLYWKNEIITLLNDSKTSGLPNSYC